MDVLRPNPARDIISLKWNDPQAYHWQLLDARGSLVQSGNHSGDLTLSVAKLPKGPYLLRTRTNEGSTQEQRWVKE